MEIDENLLAGAGEDARRYLQMHRIRYKWLLRALEETRRELGEVGRLRILDVGQSFLTHLIRRAHPQAVVDTLNNYDDPRYPERDRHFVCDLNEAALRTDRSELGPYHIVVLAEVLEHLYTSPHVVLRFLGSALEEGGYLLLQTPNAAAVHKRVALLFGRNPYEQIRENRSGHFREYTPGELAAIAAESGFCVMELSVKNYFRPPRRLSRTLNRLGDFLPPNFREGITLRLKKTKAL
ncbi:MAG: class I SAM-dependent methyltransferase [Acidobacteria bacterium]|nr:class I SAM-dependent methyltransferase [Acidobacteriota bacterium]